MLPRPARAGAQIEEPLADAVRSALAKAIANAAPPKPAFETIDERLKFLRWLGAMSERLKRYKDEHPTRVEFLETLWYESKRPAWSLRWCSGWSRWRAAFASSSSRVPARAATCR